MTPARREPGTPFRPSFKKRAAPLPYAGAPLDGRDDAPERLPLPIAAGLLLAATAVVCGILSIVLETLWLFLAAGGLAAVGLACAVYGGFRYRRRLPLGAFVTAVAMNTAIVSAVGLQVYVLVRYVAGI